MKGKLYKLFGIFLSSICIMYLCSIPASAASSVVATKTVTHVHTAEGGSCYTPVYHVHTGSSSSKGGCYTVEHKTTNTWTSTTCCASCGEGPNAHYAGNPYGACGSFNPNWSETKTTWKLGCGKDETTIDSYNLTCTKAGSTEETISLVKNHSGSTYTLSVSFTNSSSYCDLRVKSWSTGSTATSINVTGNGTYWVDVYVTQGGTTNTVRLSYTVSDYDTQAPRVSGVSYSNQRATSDKISVTATDNVKVTQYMIRRN